MKIQVQALSLGETTDIDPTPRLDTHPLKRRHVGYRGDDQAACILEADEAAIKQVINTGCQQQAVFTVEAFFIR